MDGLNTIRTSTEGLAMVMIAEAAQPLKRFLQNTNVNSFAQSMVLKMVLAFISHTGRMTCSQAAGSVASEAVHRGQLTRFLARPRWQKDDINEALRAILLQQEAGAGIFVFVIDATLASQAGVKTENTYCTSRRERKKKNRRYKKVVHKKCHSFTFGLLITPSGTRIPYQIPHYTKEYCAVKNIPHRTTAQAAAELIRGLPLPEDAEVVVLGDTAYEAQAVRDACDDRGYTWIFPANHERVYEGPKGKRPKLRSRLKDWTKLSTKTIRLRPSTGKYAEYRRISRWRVGPRQKPRVYYAYQEKLAVRHVGDVQLVFSTTKPNLEKATADDVKILMTNARSMSVTEVIELYSLRWQIEVYQADYVSSAVLYHIAA